MIDRDQFELIGRKHGGYASWAIWAEASHRPKPNVDDLSILDVATNPALLLALSDLLPHELSRGQASGQHQRSS
jgi:hypothetical protein